MTERYLTTMRGNVCYWMERNHNPGARWLIFLHGLTADHTLFDRQIDFFKERYSVLVWDAPAHGQSRPYEEFTYPNAAEDLKQIMDQEAIAQAVFVGQSMGGYVIQAFLLKYADKAEAFIGIDTCPFGLNYYSKSDCWWLRQMEWMCSCYPHKLLVRAVASGCTTTPYSYDNMLKALAPYSKKELCHLLGIGYAGFLEINQDLEISCPVLIIVGEKDRTGKVRQYCTRWHENTGYPIRWITGAAHNSNADNPQAVNAAIQEFITAVN